MNACFLLLGFVGHLALWVAGYNRISASGWSYRRASLLRKICLLIMVGWPLLVLSRLAPWPSPASLLTGPVEYSFTTVYLVVCLLWLSWVLVHWCRRILSLDGRFQPSNQDRKQVCLADLLGEQPVQGSMACWLGRMPGNQVLQLEVNRKQLDLPRCPEALDGLTVTHVSDIHISRHFSSEFYGQLIEQVNQLESDVIALTGDLADLDPVPGWVVELYGQLIASAGVYFILGNHDFRKSQSHEFRQALVKEGLVDLGKQVLRQEIAGTPVDWIGNEHPWSDVVPGFYQSSPAVFSIALAHSPDQFGWAQQHQVDLVLAGHMHGGQIQLPGIGPIVGPSRYGVTYSEGCFRSGATTMHVTRGAGGLVPLRLNCAPEISRLEIRRAT
ncbi:MAG: metallophosphoesterase [Planctomycetaceae bacterium]|nr:metallophosphoesterase [Planctomycetaceae bacterium]